MYIINIDFSAFPDNVVVFSSVLIIREEYYNGGKQVREAALEIIQNLMLAQIEKVNTDAICCK